VVETILDKFLAKSTESNLLLVYYHGYGNMEGDRMVFSGGFGGSSFYWDDVRDPIMQAPGDLLMVLDCSAAPGVEQPEIRMEAGLIASPSTKQLLGACAPYSMGMRMAGADNFMTRSLCRALDNETDDDGRGMASVDFQTLPLHPGADSTGSTPTNPHSAPGAPKPRCSRTQIPT